MTFEQITPKKEWINNRHSLLSIQLHFKIFWLKELLLDHNVEINSRQLLF